MPKLSAIEEYYRCCERLRTTDNTNVSNDNIYRLLLDVRHRCKPYFWNGVLANLTADAIFEVAMRLGSKILRIWNGKQKGYRQERYSPIPKNKEL